MPTQAVYRTATLDLTVTPIQPIVYEAVVARVTADYPLPDPTPFQRPIPDAYGGLMTPPEDDPEYVRLRAGVMARRQLAVVGHLMDMAVSCEGRAEVITQHAQLAGAYRAFIADLPNAALCVSDWVAVLVAVVLSPADINELTNIILRKTPLTEAEVTDGTAMFRAVALRGARPDQPRPARAQGVKPEVAS